jgi:hypothetical protein
MTVERAPDGIEPIRAWRVWKVHLRRGEVTLRSLTDVGGKTTWPVGASLTARCRFHAHAAPARECRCGLYALRSRDAALRLAGQGAVIGEVLLWGRVVEHQHGYRAEHAVIRQLQIPVGTRVVAGAAEVLAALAQHRALQRDGAPVGLVHADSGLPLDLDDLRRVFVPEPRAPRPLREVSRAIVWACVRAGVMATWCVLGPVIGLGTFLIVGAIVVATPFVVGENTAQLLGNGVGVGAGVTTAVALVAAYLMLNSRLGTFDA